MQNRFNGDGGGRGESAARLIFGAFVLCIVLPWVVMMLMQALGIKGYEPGHGHGPDRDPQRIFTKERQAGR